MSAGGEVRRLVVFDQVHLPVLLIPAGPFYIGWVLAAGRLLPDTWPFWAGMLSILPFLGLGTVLLNDAYDTRVDRHSVRKGELASSRGRLDRRTLMLMAGGSFATAWVLGMAAGVEFGLAIMMLTALAFLYSVPPAQLSRRPGPDLVANMIGIGVVCTVAGWVLASPGSLPPAVWMATSALGTGTFFLLPALMDYESDQEGGKRTVAVALGRERTCALGLALIAAADVLIVYMSLSSVILKPSFLWLAVPIIVGEVGIFPALARRRDLLRPLTGAMGGLLFIGNLVIVLSYLDMLGPF
jgi:1,4-dihydroxy-2-naphthoate octaprenyltransferase